MMILILDSIVIDDDYSYDYSDIMYNACDSYGDKDFAIDRSGNFSDHSGNMYIIVSQDLSTNSRITMRSLERWHMMKRGREL